MTIYVSQEIFKALDALERGATPNQAFNAGTTSGLIEVITEKLPIDNIFKIAKTKPSNIKGVLFNILKQSGIEGAEESISNIAGNIADQVIMSDKSQYNLLVSKLMEQGISQKEAEKQAFTQLYVVDTLKSAVGGAISGGVVGAGASAVGMARERVAHNAASHAIDNAYNEMRENGMFGDRTKDALDTAHDARIVDREFNRGYTKSRGVMNHEETNSIIHSQTGKEAETIADSWAGEAIEGAAATGEDAGRSGGGAVSYLDVSDERGLGETVYTGGRSGERNIYSKTYQETPGTRSEKKGNIQYEYNVVGRDRALPKSLNIADSLINDGIRAIVYSGDVRAIIPSGKQVIDRADAITLSDGTVLIRDDAELPEKEIRAHEPIHVYNKLHPEIYKPIADHLETAGINITNPQGKDIVSRINRAYKRNHGSIVDTSDLSKFYEELIAQISGHHANDPEFAREMFSPLINDYDGLITAIENAHNTFLQQNTQASEKSGAFSMPENEEIRQDAADSEKQNNPKKGMFNKPLGAVDKDSMLAAGAVKQLGRTLYQNVVSAQAPLERAAKEQDKITPNRVNLAESIQQVRTAGGIVDSILDEGMTDIDGNRIGESWVEITNQIPQGKEELFSDYMLHRHHMERLQKDKPVLKTTAEESERFLKKMDLENPEFQDIAKKIHEYWDIFMRKWAVEGNLMSEETLNRLEEQYPNYVPTFRKKFDGAFSSKSRGRKIEIATPIKNATGDISEIKDIRDGFAEYINKIVRAERKNELFLNLLDFARRAPATASNYVIYTIFSIDYKQKTSLLLVTMFLYYTFSY